MNCKDFEGIEHGLVKVLSTVFFLHRLRKSTKPSVSINILWPHNRSRNFPITKQQPSVSFFRVSFPRPQIYRELTKT